MTKARKTLSDEDYRSLAEFRYLVRQFLAFSEDAARDAGLAAKQHQALLAIKGFGGCLTVGELAEKLIIQPHSAVGLVDRLVNAELVRRRPRKEDRRQVELTLTVMGEKTLASLSKTHRDELRRLMPLFRQTLRIWDSDG